MRLARTPLVAVVVRWASRRRFPVLLGLMAALLAVNLVVPDPVPFLDELLLALGTAVLAGWRRPEDGPRRHARADAPGATDASRHPPER